jgi:hypothetical protein
MELISRLFSRFRKGVRGKPLREIVRRISHEALTHCRRERFWSQLSNGTFNHFKKTWQLHLDELANQIVGKSVHLVPLDSHASTLPSGDRAVEVANGILNGRIPILGFQGQDFGKNPAWNTDFRIPYTWPRKHFASYDTHSLESPSDVKFPWELSRFQFVGVLAHAAEVTKDRRYFQEFFRLARDWSEHNPIGYSINWASSLEVAIRGANFAIALSLACATKQSIDQIPWLLALIAVHGQFLWRNLEKTHQPGNHYLGNLAGLIVMGGLLRPLFPEAEKWLTFAAKEWPTQILGQNYEDGVNREGSIHYHHFVADMSLAGSIVLERCGFQTHALVKERIEKMLLFTNAYMRPDGLAPIVGDSDDSRFIGLSCGPLRDHRHHLSTGAIWLRSETLAAAAGKCWDESIRWFGESGKALFNSLRRERALAYKGHSFPDGGVYVAKLGGNYLLVDAGEVGHHGRGGHGHLDCLSFEYMVAGTPIVIDPGTYIYTGDSFSRNAFRSTQAHNTPVIDNLEQASMSDQLFRLGCEARPGDVRFSLSQQHALFRGRHSGYERLPDPVRVRRELDLDLNSGDLLGEDHFEGNGGHLFSISFHLGLNVTAEVMPNTVKLTHPSLGAPLYFRWHTDSQALLSVEDDWLSEEYGKKLKSTRIKLNGEFVVSGKVKYSFQWKI